MLNRNGNAKVTYPSTMRPENITRKALPPPPPLPFFIFKTLPVNSMSALEFHCGNRGIPASILNESLFWKTKAMCAIAHVFSRIVKDGPSKSHQIQSKTGVLTPKNRFLARNRAFLTGRFWNPEYRAHPYFIRPANLIQGGLTVPRCEVNLKRIR